MRPNSSLAALLRQLQEADSPTAHDPDGLINEVLKAITEDARISYASTIGTELRAELRALHDDCEELRHWIGDHDACLEPGSGVTDTNADDMIAALRADSS